MSKLIEQQDAQRLLDAARAVWNAVERRHETKAPPLKYTVPWKEMVALRHAILKVEGAPDTPVETLLPCLRGETSATAAPGATPCGEPSVSPTEDSRSQELPPCSCPVQPRTGELVCCRHEAAGYGVRCRKEAAP